jgi:GNAT superfamily N-acetyltransferase
MDADTDLPELLPDVAFRRLPPIEEAIGYTFEFKRAAMGPHIVRRWPWNVKFQRDLHRRHFAEKPFFEIRRADRPVGCLSFQVKADHVRIGEFYLLPTYQGRGFGYAVLAHCLALADGLGLPIRLEHLHWNR